MRHTRHTVTFTKDKVRQRKIKKLAEAGLCNKAIAAATGYTDSQITYALAKCKRLSGIHWGYRVRWRLGKHPMFDDFMSMADSLMEDDLDRNIVPKIVHPEPKTVKIKR